ncbi:MAG: tRNA pseudouridine(55) synthase TruB [Leptolyngbya sp. PLA3]|nr:MAG: tRNA pseudouridine(55) synthase TruB [Cyanobacteria bacterium CYA]MCE7967220.1 tRNA pseudouridine(55) synthase TruB [Leptolyngbya sp. PL-A3]
MAVCARIRGKLRGGGAPRRIKVGHGGTLDPLATGLLVILIGKATRLCQQVMADDKEYLATIDLVHVSPTDDLESAPQAIDITRVPERADVERAVAGFVGTIEQVPPAHSAMWVAGQRAYDLARRGHDPALAARPVRIDAIDILRYDFPTLEVRVTCGKGTYIRSLARDIGRALRTGGMLTALRRTRIGAFRVENAHTLDTLGHTIDPWSLNLGDFAPNADNSRTDVE